MFTDNTQTVNPEDCHQKPKKPNTFNLISTHRCKKSLYIYPWPMGHHIIRTIILETPGIFRKLYFAMIIPNKAGVRKLPGLGRPPPPPPPPIWAPPQQLQHRPMYNIKYWYKAAPDAVCTECIGLNCWLNIMKCYTVEQAVPSCKL